MKFSWRMWIFLNFLSVKKNFNFLMITTLFGPKRSWTRGEKKWDTSRYGETTGRIRCARIIDSPQCDHKKKLIYVSDNRQTDKQSWVECMGALTLSHSVLLSSECFSECGTLNSAELNLCCNIHSVQLSRGEGLHSAPLSISNFPLELLLIQISRLFFQPAL